MQALTSQKFVTARGKYTKLPKAIKSKMVNTRFLIHMTWVVVHVLLVIRSDCHDELLPFTSAI